MCQRRIAALLGDLREIHIRFLNQMLRFDDPRVVDVADDRAAGLLFEFMAQIKFADEKAVGQIFQPYFLAGMEIDILDDLADTGGSFRYLLLTDTRIQNEQQIIERCPDEIPVQTVR